MPVSISIFLYLAAIFFSCEFLKSIVGGKKATCLNNKQSTVSSIRFSPKTLCSCFFCVIPIFLIYTLRDGIGTDYYGYEETYMHLHNINFFQYFSFHNAGIYNYYVEPGYYFLIRIAPNFHVLQFLNIFVMCFPVFHAIIQYQDRFAPEFPFFIFFTQQFIYSLNVVRQSIALGFILLAFVYLIRDKTFNFFISVLVAALFHTTSLFALLYFFIKEFKNPIVNHIRDITMVVLTLLIPLMGKIVFYLFSAFPVFARYFSEYPIAEQIVLNYTWWLYIVPPILPLLLLLKKKMFESKEERTMFRIYMTHVPVQLLGFYNGWLFRLTRMPQLIQIIFVPYMLKKVKNHNMHRLLILYYFLWYIFFFLFYLFRSADAVHYQWIFK